MWAISLIYSFLVLNSVSSSSAKLKFEDLPNELLEIIVKPIVVSHNFELCAYVDWLADNRWAGPCTDVGMPMLKKIAEEEKSLDLKDDKQRFRKKQILKKVRTFVRIRSRLPIDCTGIKADKLRTLAGIFKSSYEECAFLSESPTWKKACMAGLFGRNTLSTLLEYLSKDFRRHTEEILLQTAFFIGDIHSLEEIIKSFGILEDVPDMVSALDIVFSDSEAFFGELFNCLPNVMGKKPLDLIREACSLNCLDSVLGILKVAEPAELDDLDHVLESFSQLRVYKGCRVLQSIQYKLECILETTAKSGHLPMIRFLWPVMATVLSDDYIEDVIENMMTIASKSNNLGVLEFLLWESGRSYMETAQGHLNDVFETAVKGGYVDLMNCFIRNDNAGNPVAPRLSLATLKWETLHMAIIVNRNWMGIRYLVDLKKAGDSRFADFELVDHDNTALCMACEVGDYELVEYLLCTTDGGEFVFSHTNPAAQDNMPLEEACIGGHLRVMKLLLQMKDGKYVFPEMNSVDFARVLSAAIKNCRTEIVEFLLQMKNGEYVLPGMNGVDLTGAFLHQIKSKKKTSVKWLLSMDERGEDILPE